MPALLVNARTARHAHDVLELARRAETAGLAGIGIAGFGGGLAYAVSFAHETTHIPFFTCIQPIYLAHPVEVAKQANHVRAVGGDRFALGLGVSHSPMLQEAGVGEKPPVVAVRQYVSGLRAAGYDGPVYLAAVRDRMLRLGDELADGVLLAHAARSSVAARVADLGRGPNDGFVIGNVIATAVHDDPAVARAAVRRYLSTVYARLPNYREYWRSAGFASEVDRIEVALSSGGLDGLEAAFSDELLADCCLAGTPDDVRERLDGWFAAGVTLPVLQLVDGAEHPLEHLDDVLRLYR
jgi:alkanesulfonate monooxygenase SsuD/methylene tetrahydromethanopterin reductase-like flavin-dependent oxidoreductase (luciferase family)